MKAATGGFTCNRSRGAASKPGNRDSMTHPMAALLVGLATSYVVIGACFAVVFVARGIDTIDPMARGASWGFRLLVLPGSVIFWPLLLIRWAARSMAPPAELNAHRRRTRRAA